MLEPHARVQQSVFITRIIFLGEIFFSLPTKKRLCDTLSVHDCVNKCLLLCCTLRALSGVAGLVFAFLCRSGMETNPIGTQV